MLTAEQLAALPPLSPGLLTLGARPTFSRVHADRPDEDAVDEETGLPPAQEAAQSRRTGLPSNADPGLEPLSSVPAASLSALRASVLAAQRRGDGEVATVLIFCFNRPSYLRRTLGSVLRARAGDSARFPLVVSQDTDGVDRDGSQAAVAEVAAEFAGQDVGFQQHRQTEARLLHLEKPTDNRGYYHISAHYKWALDRAFGEAGEGATQRVIILEDDMEVSPDFFEYFAGLAPLLHSDPSLWCISAWNDNGRRGLAADPAALHRTDFFPGLGWMLTRTLWEQQLSASWPAAFWDDWMRLNSTRRGRQCLRPELCRTLNFGRRGTSGAAFYDTYLHDVVLAQDWIPWSSQELSFVGDGARYERSLRAQLGAAVRVRSAAEALRAEEGAVVLAYDGSQAGFKALAKPLGLFAEFKEGMPRASYRGVVQASLRGGLVRLFVAPEGYLRQAAAELRARLEAEPAED